MAIAIVIAAASLLVDDKELLLKNENRNCMQITPGDQEDACGSKQRYDVPITSPQ